MNQYVTGQTIKALREKNSLTQTELGDKLGVSDKSVSKWETGNGYPDISLLEPISKVFNVSVIELFSGNMIENRNKSANLKKTEFYVCPVCGNVITATGESVISCHGITLPALKDERENDSHKVSVEKIEDEYYVKIDHEMTKNHYISFIAAVSCDRIQLAKLYPEQEAEAYFKTGWVEKIYYFCNKDGLFGLCRKEFRPG